MTHRILIACEFSGTVRRNGGPVGSAAQRKDRRVTRWLPRMDLCRWGGGDIDGHNDVKGWSLCFQWGAVLVELCAGRVVR